MQPWRSTEFQNLLYPSVQHFYDLSSFLVIFFDQSEKATSFSRRLGIVVQDLAFVSTGHRSTMVCGEFADIYHHMASVDSSLFLAAFANSAYLCFPELGLGFFWCFFKITQVLN